MNGSSTSSPSGLLARLGVGPGLSGVREIVDQLRFPNDERPATRTERGDVRAAVLTTLAEQPADGYQIVRVLEERSSGERTPGAGAVYPMLQLLFDEGLVTVTEVDGKKTWTLTPTGRTAAEAAHERPAARAASAAGAPPRRGAIARSGAQLAQTVALAVQSGAPDQIEEIVAVLDDARRRVLSILARS